MTVYEVKPHEGIGPVRLGMRRTDVRAALPEPPDPFRKGPDAEHETDAFDGVGLHVYYRGAEPVAGFIEAFPADGVRFVLLGMDLFGSPAASVAAALSAQAEVAVEDEGTTVVLPDLDISPWRASEDDEGFAAVGVGEPGYFAARSD